MKQSHKIEPGLYETDEGDRIQWQDKPAGWVLTHAGETEPVDHLYATKSEILKELDAPDLSGWDTWACPKTTCSFSTTQHPSVMEVSHLCGVGKRTVRLKKQEDGMDLI